jgi:hypothetical protein
MKPADVGTSHRRDEADNAYPAMSCSAMSILCVTPYRLSRIIMRPRCLLALRPARSDVRGCALVGSLLLSFIRPHHKRALCCRIHRSRLLRGGGQGLVQRPWLLPERAGAVSRRRERPAVTPAGAAEALDIRRSQAAGLQLGRGLHFRKVPHPALAPVLGPSGGGVGLGAGGGGPGPLGAG